MSKIIGVHVDLQEVTHTVYDDGKVIRSIEGEPISPETQSYLVRIQDGEIEYRWNNLDTEWKPLEAGAQSHIDFANAIKRILMSYYFEEEVLKSETNENE